MSALSDVCKKYKVGEPDSETTLRVYRENENGVPTSCASYSVALDEQEIARQLGYGTYHIDVVGYDAAADDDEVLEDTLVFTVPEDDEENPLEDLVGAVHDLLWDEKHRGEDIEAMARRVKKERDELRRIVEAQRILASGREETIERQLREIRALRDGGAKTIANTRNELAMMRDSVEKMQTRLDRETHGSVARASELRCNAEGLSPHTRCGLQIGHGGSHMAMSRR